MKKRPLNQIDFYKSGHRPQYIPGTQKVVSNFTPRGSRINGINKLVWFNLQYLIKEYLIHQWNKYFFEKPKDEVLHDYKRRINNALGEGTITFEHIEALHDLGYLPLEIYALPEGTRVPMRVPAMIFWNTKDEFFWLTNYLETVMSSVIWGPCTSATLAYEYKKLLNHYAMLTVGNTDFVQFQGHDFSARGMYGMMEAAPMSGAGHLLLFVGTDTVSAIDFLEDYYNANSDKELVGCSVPATEHSVMCMGLENHEFETFERLIIETYPNGIVSIVSDSWDFWHVITDYMIRLKDIIMNRNGKVVLRPDSGDPVKIISGWNIVTEISDNLNIDDVLYFKDEKYFKLKKKPSEFNVGYVDDFNNKTILKQQYELEEVPACVAKGAVECLWEIFGGTITEKGFKLLDSHIGLIYGDSITIPRAEEICRRLMNKGFASINTVLGIGSYTYQYVTRDTFGMAVKATYGEVDGQPRNIFKKPKTDDGTKDSSKGLLAVYYDDNNELYCFEGASWEQVRNCEFQQVFKDGKLLIDQSLSEIRQRLSLEDGKKIVQIVDKIESNLDKTINTLKIMEEKLNNA